MSEPKEYNYMIKLREFIKTGEEIQKIGFSTIPDKNNPLITKRFKQYPSGSLPIMCALVNDGKKLENLIIKVFSEKFKRRRDIGKEYFEGDIDQMALEFTFIVKNWGNSIITLTSIEDEVIEDKPIKITTLIHETGSVTCEKCNEWFKSMYYYNRHKNKKFPCSPEEKEKLDMDNRICLYCKHIYSTPYVLKTHLLTCKNRPTELEELKQLILKLTETNNKLTEKNTQQFKELAEKNTQQFTKLENKIDNLKKPTKKSVNKINDVITDDDYICETNLFIQSKNTNHKLQLTLFLFGLIKINANTLYIKNIYYKLIVHYTNPFF
jgi:hypothetical protein